VPGYGGTDMRYGKPSEDFGSVRFGDKRLDERLCKTVASMEQDSQGSILGSSGSRHDAKAFYSLLGNENFEMEELETAAYRATGRRILESGIGRVLLPQDTCDVTMNGHEKTEGLGYCNDGVKGVICHSSVAFTEGGEPLGLVWQQYDSRPENKMNKEGKEKAQCRPIEEKESYKWIETTRKVLERVPETVESVVICDREGDMYELYAEAQKLGCLFVVRMVQDRVTTGDDKSIQQLRRTKAIGEVDVEIPRDSRNNVKARTAKMEVAGCGVAVVRPKRTDKGQPGTVVLNLVRITEVGSEGEPIEWLLATNLPVGTAEEIMLVVGYYVVRWKIERFHYVLKSGCQAEKIQQRSYGRIKPVLFIYSVIAVYILAMTLAARAGGELPCDAFLEPDEWKVLFTLINRGKKPPKKPYPLSTAVAYLGELGSFRHSPSDGPYGVKAIWRGLFKLFVAIDSLARFMGQV